MAIKQDGRPSAVRVSSLPVGAQARVAYQVSCSTAQGRKLRRCSYLGAQETCGAADPMPVLDHCGLRMIHLKTAKVLGITIPPSLLAGRADRVDATSLHAVCRTCSWQLVISIRTCRSHCTIGMVRLAERIVGQVKAVGLAGSLGACDDPEIGPLSLLSQSAGSSSRHRTPSGGKTRSTLPPNS